MFVDGWVKVSYMLVVFFNLRISRVHVTYYETEFEELTVITFEVFENL